MITISEEYATFNCDICGMILKGQEESEEHLRGEHLEGYKSVFAKECFLKTRDHEKSREWEVQEVSIEELNFAALMRWKHMDKKSKIKVQMGKRVVIKRHRR